MQNLAGQKSCDIFIHEELRLAGIPITTRCKGNGEVPYTLSGEIVNEETGFKFTRAWYYWIAEGTVKNSLARIMFEEPEGKKSIRVNGYAGNIDPGTDDINCYHIDSQAGLNLFVKTVCR